MKTGKGAAAAIGRGGRGSKRPEITDEQRQEIKEAFDLFDTDNSGAHVRLSKGQRDIWGGDEDGALYVLWEGVFLEEGGRTTVTVFERGEKGSRRVSCRRRGVLRRCSVDAPRLSLWCVCVCVCVCATLESRNEALLLPIVDEGERGGSCSPFWLRDGKWLMMTGSVRWRKGQCDSRREEEEERGAARGKLSSTFHSSGQQRQLPPRRLRRCVDAGEVQRG